MCVAAPRGVSAGKPLVTTEMARGPYMVNLIATTANFFLA
jgi:hypothetical protein